MLWLIPLFPIVAAALLYLHWAKSHSRLAIALSATAVVTAELALVLWAESFGWTGSLSWSSQLQLTTDFTPATFLAAMVVPVVAAPIVFYAAAHEDTDRLGRLVTLLVAFIGVMQLIILARDLLSLLIAWEIAGALSWLLIGHRFQDKERGRHASQAFLATRAGDLGLYLATFIAFQQTGSLAYAGLDQMSPLATSLFAAGVTMAALSKSAQLPFSPWLFSAMSGPASVSALLHAATMVAAGVVLLVQFQPMLAGVSWFGPVLVTVGLATAFAGGLVAAASPHAKRLLAGSTSAHYGLMFVAIGAGYPAVALLHFALHALMKAPLFIMAGIAGHRADSYNLAQIARVPLPRDLKYVNAIAALALAGLFPLGAAWSKEGVLSAAGLITPWLAVLVAFAGGLSALYAARFQCSLFFHHSDRHESDQPKGAMGWSQRAPLYLLASLVLLSSVLWLPNLHSQLSQWLSLTFPSTKLWEFALSLALVLLGLFGGYRMAVRELGQGDRGASAVRDFLAQWMFLPHLARRLIVIPVDALARRLASLDDQAVDAGIRASAHFALWLASVGNRSGEWTFDQLPKGFARFGQSLATFGSRFLEWLSDQLPEAPAHLSGQAGHQVRRLQSGMLHHYYSLMAVGVGVFVLTLVLAIIKGGLS
ncbi:NADH:ubiquinone oxidoreductase subunit 5 (subunit L)/multisubunit Na+/H+ antiporter MnhA subunit [Marinobacter sp. LV10R520-4]|nr:proton-conducting transporter membrane subunit [Marinobacter sp. LV10R520-4]PFG54448.1 NADH:ubiquinone oxidoreductase subunit 5 (subunit L)/multisubunit Na+/H+ antiporter MnhA subunit [Marinobacter sp. LV10R520-4]